MIEESTGHAEIVTNVSFDSKTGNLRVQKKDFYFDNGCIVIEEEWDEPEVTPGLHQMSRDVQLRIADRKAGSAILIEVEND